MQDDFDSECWAVSEDLRRANETIGSLRNQLHYAEIDKRKLAAEVERLKSNLADFHDVGDMALEAAGYLAMYASHDEDATHTRERIEAWHERIEAQELEAVQ